jgi:hypothetical protein
MNQTTRRMTFATAIIFALAVMAVCPPCHAKLSSTKAQVAKMVAAAMRTSEKLYQRLTDAYGKQEDYAGEIADLAKEIRGYEGGILSDMAVANDVARLLVYSRYKDTKLFAVIDDFDRAADHLAALDRKRYYTAKARLRSGWAAPQIDLVTLEWFSCLSADCRRAARRGADAGKCASFARAFAKKNKIQDRLLDESVCRISQESARYFTAEAFRLSRSRDRDKALKVALQGIKEIEPLTVIADTDGCTRWKSEGVLLARYDSLFVRPLCAAAGGTKNADEVRVEVCDRYWQYRSLVSAVLPRVTTPSSGAFGLFKKAGKDDVLRHDSRIAVAEVELWKKAKKLKKFKTDFPERYALAKRSTAAKKRR